MQHRTVLRNPNVPTRWVVATLLLVIGTLAVRVTMLDDSWLRLLLAGGDRMGQLASERRIRGDAQRAAETRSRVESPVPAQVDAPPPDPDPLP